MPRLLGALIAATALLACDRRGVGTSGAAPREERSTVDDRIARIAGEEIDRAATAWSPAAALAVIVDPSRGAVLGMAGRDRHGPAPRLAVERAYITGSTLKTFTIAGALEEGAIAPDDRFSCEPRAYGAETLEDARPCAGVLSVGQALASSSNVGTSRIFDRLGLARLDAWLARFHLDERSAAPPVTDASSFQAAMLAIGERRAVSPLQVAAAFGAIVNDGVYLAPTFVPGTASEGERVLSAPTARRLLGMLEGVVTSGTGKLAAIPGHRVVGKSGTADLGGDGGDHFYASFVGAVVDHQPPLVVLVGLDDPREGGTGASAAAPAFARIATRLLTLDAR